jgi:hypothetical protein
VARPRGRRRGSGWRKRDDQRTAQAGQVRPLIIRFPASCSANGLCRISHARGGHAAHPVPVEVMHALQTLVRPQIVGDGDGAHAHNWPIGDRESLQQIYSLSRRVGRDGRRPEFRDHELHHAAFAEEAADDGVAVGERVPQAPAGFAALEPASSFWLPGPNIIRQRDPKSQTKSQRQPKLPRRVPAARNRHSSMPHQAMASIQPPGHWHACAAGAGSIKRAAGRPAPWGAKRGANDGRHQATPGHCQRSPSLVNGTLSLVEPRPATGLTRLTSEGSQDRNLLRPPVWAVQRAKNPGDHRGVRASPGRGAADRCAGHERVATMTR